MLTIFLILLVGIINVSFSTVCNNDFEETVCENFSFFPELLLDSATNKLTIKNAVGSIIHENFSKLDQTTEIKITDSDIKEIEPAALCCVPNLTSVSITNNVKFPKITKKVLQGCQQIKNMYFNGKEVEIMNGAFVDVKNLQTLSLNNTALPCHFGETTFKGLATLKSLTISHTTCKKITRDAFDTFENLKFLDLQNNNIENIDSGAFRNLKLLKVLNLSDNKLKNLTWIEFEGLSALRVLFLERNRFSDVDVEKLVSTMPNLERIFFSHDQLSVESRKKIEDVLPKLNITFIYSGMPLE